MAESKLEQAILTYLDKPTARHLDRFLTEARSFIAGVARNWHSSGLSFADRCSELLSEVFLILTQDVRPDKVSHPNSLLAFLSLRLRRLTKCVSGRLQRSVPVGLVDDLPEVGRCNFTILRLELVDALVRCVRTALVTDTNAHTRLLEALFLHIRPELVWASRTLAKYNEEKIPVRYEADKKRHQQFTRRLRTAFDSIDCADWREIADWSSGERSHLAWRIISLSPSEEEPLTQQQLQTLTQWRDVDVSGDEQSPKALVDSVASLIAAFRGRYSAPRCAAVSMAKEEAAAYGADAVEEDPLALLLQPIVSLRSSEAAHEWHETPGEYEHEEQQHPLSAAELDAYAEAAQGVRTWMLNLQKSMRGKKIAAIAKAASSRKTYQ